jgi:glycosyltransferase involved in cell wall biosynthesis
MKADKYRISLVIPAYNEEAYIAQCLQAALGQAEPFYEIIVVDNNSTDNTARIARSFKNVTVITEKRQGVVFARSKGFDTARGDIIARIDVDTRLTPEWSRQVAHEFQDVSLAAVSGRPTYYDVTLEKFVVAVENSFRRQMARALSETQFLQGANMAIRKSSWLQIKKHLCYKHNMHEDFDLAIHLQEYGHKVIYSEDLVAGLSARRVDIGFLSYVRYVGMSPHTYALHEVSGRHKMYPVIAFVILIWLPARILYRGYNPETDSFSWRRLFSQRKLLMRTDPTRA